MLTTATTKAEIDQAQKDLDELLAAARSGEDVTAGQLAEARAAVELAELRAAGAATLEERNAQAARRAAIEQLEADTRAAFADHDGSLLDGFDEIVAAATSFAETVAAHNARHAELIERRTRLHGPQSDPGVLNVAGVTIGQVDVTRLLAEVAYRAARAVGVPDSAPAQAELFESAGFRAPEPDLTDAYGTPPGEPIAMQGSDRLRWAARAAAAKADA